MANPGLREFQALAKLARDNNIDANGKDRAGIVQALKDAGIEHDIPEDLANTEQLTPAPKKGHRSWNPAQRLDVVGKAKGFRYRWCNNDPANIEKKLAEGWVLVNKTTNLPGEHERRETPQDGANLTTAKTYREMVLMALPEDIALDRDRYVNEQSQKQVLGLKTATEREHQKQTASGIPTRPLHGTIVIS